MDAAKYYLRIQTSEVTESVFEAYLRENSIQFELISRDSVAGVNSCMYAATMTAEQELVTRLKFKLKGCLNFSRTLGRLVKPLSTD